MGREVEGILKKSSNFVSNMLIMNIFQKMSISKSLFLLSLLAFTSCKSKMNSNQSLNVEENNSLYIAQNHLKKIFKNLPLVHKNTIFTPRKH